MMKYLATMIFQDLVSLYLDRQEDLPVELFKWYDTQA